MDGAKLFRDVNFVLAECNNSSKIKALLLEGGAKHMNYLVDSVTHVLADTKCPEAEEAVEIFDKPVVTSLWVHQCLKAKSLLPPEAFSPMRRTFQDVTVAFSEDISQGDVEKLAAVVTYHGGQVTTNLRTSTHLITTSASSSDSSEDKKSKIVAPDWIIDSIRLQICCDEKLYEPGLLNGPPPPTPLQPPTPPLAPREPPQALVTDPKLSKELQIEDKDADESIYRPESHNILREQAMKNAQTVHNQIPQPQTQRPIFPNQTMRPQRPVGQYIQQTQQSNMPAQSQMMPTTQLPRPRMSPNMISRAPGQPRFRPLLQNPIMPGSQRQPVQMVPPGTRPMGQDQRNPTIDYNNSYRKAAPYHNGPSDMHHMPQQPQNQPYQTVQHVPMQPHQGNIINQHPPSRIPQPNMYHQPRGPYPNNQMQPRMVPNQSQMMNQPMQQIERFQDPNNPMAQRPYQAYPQQQPMPPNYPQQGMNRQATYYAQGPNNQMAMRPQQVPINRPIMHQNDDYQEPYGPSGHQVHHESPMQQGQSQYQQSQFQHQPSSMHPHPHHQQPQTQPNQHQAPPPPHMPANQRFQQPHHSQMIIQTRQPQQPQSNTLIQSANVRAPRIVHPSPQQQDIRHVVVRQPSTPQVASHPQIRSPRVSLAQPSQPHPSIFDNKQETNLSQLRAKVPDVTERIKYHGYETEFEIPEDKLLIGCRFKMIEHEDVPPEDKEFYIEAIEEAGGVFIEDDSKLTHLICQTRLSKTFNLALKEGIRCITMYWINDVIAQNRLSYPWKALHFPMWHKLADRPLKDQMITITNIKGRERREVMEMIVKTGAKFTDTFCAKNTLLICGSPGGEKYERAIEWRTPIANCQILSDFIVGENRDFLKLLPLAKYQNFNRSQLLSLDSYSRLRDIMSPWMKPIPSPPKDDQDTKTDDLTNGTKQEETPINQVSEDSGIATSGSNNSDGDANNKLSPPKLIDSNHINCDDKTASMKDQPITNDTGAKVIPPSEPKVAINNDSDKSVSAIDPNNQKTNESEIDNGGVVPMEISEVTDLINHVVPSVAEKIAPEIDEDKFVDCQETQSSECVVTQAAVEKSNEQAENTESVDISANKYLLRTSDEPARILFTRLDRQLVTKLQSYALELKLGLASCANDCTHLVIDRISRTPKFICALNHAKYILDVKWLTESHKAMQVLDEKTFILQDPEGEEKFSFSLVRSLLKRKKRGGKLLFNNFIFFVTPSVIAKVANLKEMIESAGGSMVTRKPPSRAQFVELKSKGKRFIVVTNQQDFHLVSSWAKYGVDIVGSEFIMSGILRQDIDFPVHTIRSRDFTTTEVLPQSPKELVQLKKLRVE